MKRPADTEHSYLYRAASNRIGRHPTKLCVGGGVLWFRTGEFNPNYTRSLEYSVARRLTRNTWAQAHD